MKEQAAAIEILHERLVGEYGVPIPQRALPALDELVLTILSQNTTDTNRDRAWTELKQSYPDWESVAQASLRSLEEALQPGGLQRVKARRIKDLLLQIKREHGAYDLEHLRNLDLTAAREALSGYKGLGAKSINCILLFSLKKPAFPVDTHVFRMLQRIGIHATKDLTRANNELQEAVPDEISYPFHMNVIRHGREVCTARSPKCWRCCVTDLCGFDQKTVE